jgi:hypothetical protein
LSGSAITPTRIVDAVMPRPDPPVADPGAQAFLTSPKSPAAAALLEELDVADEPPAELLGADVPVPDRLQPAPTSPSATSETITSGIRVPRRRVNKVPPGTLRSTMSAAGVT